MCNQSIKLSCKCSHLDSMREVSWQTIKSLSCSTVGPQTVSIFLVSTKKWQCLCFFIWEFFDVSLPKNTCPAAADQNHKVPFSLSYFFVNCSLIKCWGWCEKRDIFPMHKLIGQAWPCIYFEESLFSCWGSDVVLSRWRCSCTILQIGFVLYISRLYYNWPYQLANK